MTEHYAPCSLVHLFGYGYVNRIPEQLSVDFNRPVYDTPQEGFYNMHDIRRLFGPEADGGFFLQNDWPLWPQEDKALLDEFLHYRQVLPLPRRLIVMNTVSKLTWLAWLAAAAVILTRKKKATGK